ncbi:MAG: hypothetical protein A2X05_04180 [Bacteroidetes bacterium GWE2_41_25]|nr:MAG: hypothetical protein A2X03_01110 [Bacteroidetes bacterium GWA2_40_15]OFX94556.1 MAG: hypothetical protein A2X05_04180 [Bacteroidetes bacterium GWE2_41_25]OFX96815.1 MAG: hypothetical protein A2X06_11790 [Bacteroidetes bacterium GWC2_40_22]OFY59091.1 MAG: hypothetical protein A2X04_13710 [Bacteroidetes bacterium GWF2_41_9]HAM11023.1 hypothetical protein [Bacteroidales bacterium]
MLIELFINKYIVLSGGPVQNGEMFIEKIRKEITNFYECQSPFSNGYYTGIQYKCSTGRIIFPDP